MHHNVIVIDRKLPGLNPVQLGYEDCAPSHSYGPAVRTHWLLHYIVRGFGSFTREGKTYRLGPGEIFVIPPYLETYYEADRDQPWQYIWIGFTADMPLPAPFSEPVLCCPGAGAVFEAMKRSAMLENGRSAFLSARLWDLMSILQEQGAPEADYIDKALHCIRSEYMRELSVQELAERLNLDRSYFSGLFRKRTGVSPGRYLMTFRLEKAAELMVEHGERPSTAALSVGYSDLFNFSKAFKKHFGLAPRDYIKAKSSR